MKSKINFKSGMITGGILGLALVVSGFFLVQNMMENAENISNFDLHELSYQNLDGDEVMLYEFEGKHVLVNFWATWCAPCVKEFPLLEQTYNELNEEVVFVMVSYESIDDIKEFKENHPYNFVFLKSDNFMLKGITVVPQTFFLNKKGENIHHQPTIFEGSVESITARIMSWMKTL